MGKHEDGTQPVGHEKARDLIRLRIAYIRLYRQYLDLQGEYEILRTIVETRIDEN